MADDLPRYKAWLLSQRCACHPCVCAVVVHHHTSGETFAPGARPEKALGGKRGKGQRASDYYGIPLCNRHHGQFHAVSGPFDGWTGLDLKEWQDTQVNLWRTLYDEACERDPSLLDDSQDRQPKREAKLPPKKNDAVAVAAAERSAIARWLEARAAEARLLPDVAAELLDLAELLKARTRPMAEGIR